MITRESAHEMLTTGACTICALEFSEGERVAYLSASCEEKLCAYCYAAREHEQTAAGIGAALRELDISARERRAFPSRQQMVQRIKEHVFPEAWPLVEALLIGILVDASLPEDARCVCAECGYEPLTIPAIAKREVCGSRQLRRI